MSAQPSDRAPLEPGNMLSEVSDAPLTGVIRRIQQLNPTAPIFTLSSDACRVTSERVYTRSRLSRSVERHFVQRHGQ